MRGAAFFQQVLFVRTPLERKIGKMYDIIHSSNNTSVRTLDKRLN